MFQQSIKCDQAGLLPIEAHTRKVLGFRAEAEAIGTRREINCKGEDLSCSLVEVYGDKIIIGLDGRIEIYDKSDVTRFQTALKYCMSRSIKPILTCHQFTGLEIIAGFDDGKIVIWSIEGEEIVPTLSIDDDNGEKDFGTTIRWRHDKMVVGTDKRWIKIGKRNGNSFFTLIYSWIEFWTDVRQLDFNDNYIMIRLNVWKSTDIQVRYLHGRHLRSITSPAYFDCAALYNGYAIGGGRDKLLRI